MKKICLFSNKKIVMTRHQKRTYRLFLCMLLLINAAGFSMWYLNVLDRKIPTHIYLFQNQNAKLNWAVPLEGACEESKDVIAITNQNKSKIMNQSFGLDEPVTVTASARGTYQAELKLFGLFHYKNIQFDVIEKAKVMPSGKAVGLYVQSDGIMVLGTSKIQGKDGLSYEPAQDILQPGDIIKKIEGKKVENIDQVIDAIQKEKKEKLTLEMIRGKNTIHVKLDRILAKDGEYKIGAWLREDTEGIGTLSFVTEENEFAALGHGITDVDTGKLIHLNQGDIYPAHIEDIQKGKAGSPGELIGSVSLGDENCIGGIQSNTSLGITGKVTGEKYSYQQKDAMPIGLKQEVKTGQAYIMCQLLGNVEKFEVSIEEVNVNSQDNKGMVLKITDQKLLKKAGGIVQGMSGAPIIQNGKVIGAVTHVFVNEPTGGYGTFIENML